MIFIESGKPAIPRRFPSPDRRRPTMLSTLKPTAAWHTNATLLRRFGMSMDWV